MERVFWVSQTGKGDDRTFFYTKEKYPFPLETPKTPNLFKNPDLGPRVPKTRKSRNLAPDPEIPKSGPGPRNRPNLGPGSGVPGTPKSADFGPPRGPEISGREARFRENRQIFFEIRVPTAGYN